MALPFAVEVSFRKHLCHLVLKFLTWPSWKPQRPLWYCLQPHNALLFSYPIPFSALLFLVCSSVLLLTSPLYLATSESALSPQQGYLFPFSMPPSTSPTFECGHLCFKPKICLLNPGLDIHCINCSSLFFLQKQCLVGAGITSSLFKFLSLVPIMDVVEASI